MKSLSLKQANLLSIFALMSVLVIISFSSCKKDETAIKSDSYYIQYVINGNGAYGYFSNWTATTPEGIYTNNGYQTKSWSQTYGPVKKGFKCEVQIRDYIGGAPTIKIHVSKNDEPFALKVTNTGNSGSYIISF